MKQGFLIYIQIYLYPNIIDMGSFKFSPDATVVHIDHRDDRWKLGTAKVCIEYSSKLF